MNFISDQPLSMDEINSLHTFLSLPHEEAKPMSITKAHGFLTAVLSSPELIMPSQWQSALLGGQTNFNTFDEAKKIIELLSQFNNQISRELRDDHPFEPLLFTENRVVPFKEASFELIGEWCQGYIEGTKLGPPFSNEEEAMVIIPFAHLAGLVSFNDQKDKDGNIIDDDTTLREKVRLDLPKLIKGLFIAWQENRKQKSTTFLNEFDDFDFPEPIRNDFKIGRNEPCPCGSNKKYKKCCLGKETLH